jgi:hypothetical protein
MMALDRPTGRPHDRRQKTTSIAPRQRARRAAIREGELLMAHPKMFLLSAAVALAIALPAFAQDTKHVKWHDDGTVDLIMDPEYGGTITTTKD